MFDDIHDLSRENVHDYMDEGEIQRIGQKRSNSHKLKEDCHITVFAVICVGPLNYFLTLNSFFSLK